jgi:hypothetical protein
MTNSKLRFCVSNGERLADTHSDPFPSSHHYWMHTLELAIDEYRMCTRRSFVITCVSPIMVIAQTAEVMPHMQLQLLQTCLGFGPLLQRSRASRKRSLSKCYLE